MFYEEKLGLARKMQAVEEQANKLHELSKSTSLPVEIHDQINVLAELIRQ